MGIKKGIDVNMSLQVNLKVILALLVSVISVAGMAQQTNTLDTLKQTFEKHKLILMAQYGKDLDAGLSVLKTKGDLDNVLILQGELKRFDAEGAVPAPKDAKDAFRPAAIAYCQSMVSLMGKYTKALEAAIKEEVAADRIEEAKLIKAEKEKVGSMLTDAQASLPVKEISQAEKPKQETHIPAALVFKPKTYVDETKGWAGITPLNNIYKFNIETVGRKAIFRFWASGDIGTATTGQVLLSGENIQEQIIRQWEPKDFKIAANTVSSYKKLKPISCDISSYVKQPGEYQFTFRWGGSQVGLSILRVELELQ